MFLLSETPSCLLLFWLLYTQWERWLVLRVCVCRVHTRVLVQLTSECAAGSVKASMLPCVSSQLSFVVFSQLVSGG